ILRKGFIYSNIYNNGVALCSLPPRYQKITEQVKENFNIHKIEDGRLKKGIKGIIEWIKEFKDNVSEKVLFGNSAG
ncbi:MAG: hypothetical protein FWH22_11225, partial [Fibromonadales bacterium]|nr:hypothetical protein [Fibromonadales bacterium]